MLLGVDTLVVLSEDLVLQLVLLVLLVDRLLAVTLLWLLVEK